MKKIIKLDKNNKPLLTKKENLYIPNISFSASNYTDLRVHKSKQINVAIQQQNIEYMQIHDPDYLTVTPIIDRSNYPTRPFSQFINIIVKPPLMHIMFGQFA